MKRRKVITLRKTIGTVKCALDRMAPDIQSGSHTVYDTKTTLQNLVSFVLLSTKSIMMYTLYFPITHTRKQTALWFQNVLFYSELRSEILFRFLFLNIYLP